MTRAVSLYLREMIRQALPSCKNGSHPWSGQEPGFATLGWENVSRGTRAIGPAPIVALLTEWQRQGMPQGVVGRLEIARDTDGDSGLGNIAPQAAVQQVPPGEDDTVVRVGFRFHHRMMDAVHAWCHHKGVEQAFNAERKPHIRVFCPAPLIPC